jgi:hypothetical protein
MFERILKLMREKIRKKEYIMTLHAEEEMSNDDLTIYEVESGILSGQIVEGQKDRETDEQKYRITGLTLSGETIEVVAKISPTGKLVIITVYAP